MGKEMPELSHATEKARPELSHADMMDLLKHVRERFDEFLVRLNTELSEGAGIKLDGGFVEVRRMDREGERDRFLLEWRGWKVESAGG